MLYVKAGEATGALGLESLEKCWLRVHPQKSGFGVSHGRGLVLQVMGFAEDLDHYDLMRRSWTVVECGLGVVLESASLCGLV